MRTDKFASGALLWLLAFPAVALQAVGSAVSIEQERLLYREVHRCDPAGIRCTVDYLDPEGEQFARKRLDYSAAPWAPSLHFADWRQGEQVSLEASSQPADVVIDAGFDNYVRERWDLLVAGEPVVFQFLPASLSRPIAMRAEAEENCGRDRLCISVRPESWLLGLFGGEISLVYSRPGQRLLEFRGVSNIEAADGAAQQVRIRYEYQSGSPAEPQAGPGDTHGDSR